MSYLDKQEADRIITNEDLDQVGPIIDKNLMAIRAMVVTLLAASGPVSAAYIADSTGSYTAAFYIYVCLAGLPSLLIFAMPLPKSGAKKTGSEQVINGEV